MTDISNIPFKMPFAALFEPKVTRANAEKVTTIGAIWLGLALLICMPGLAIAQDGDSLRYDFPRYKPSSRAPAAVDIRSNRYGASRSAPNALAIGEQAPDFSAPKAGGGLVSLRQLRKDGDVVIIFYRGHW